MQIDGRSADFSSAKKKKKKKKIRLNRMWCNTACLKCFKRRLSLRGVLLTQFPRRINDEVWRKKKTTIDEWRICIFRQTPNLLSRGSKCTFFFPLSLSSHLLIPNPIHQEWRWVKIAYFVKCDQFEPRIHRTPSVCFRTRFSEVVSRFLNPQVSSGHITKPTQFGSELAVFAHMRPRI